MKDILLAKYSLSHLFSFWTAVLKDKDLIDLSFNKHLSSGDNILFWINR
jgi:hypothetical protein